MELSWSSHCVAQIPDRARLSSLLTNKWFNETHDFIINFIKFRRHVLDIAFATKSYPLFLLVAVFAKLFGENNRTRSGKGLPPSGIQFIFPLLENLEVGLGLVSIMASFNPNVRELIYKNVSIGEMSNDFQIRTHGE